MGQRYRRSRRVTEREVGKFVFLADPDDGTVSKLNEMGTALWRLLAEPVTVEEAVAVFRRAFPDTPQDEVEEDVRSLFEVFIDDELVEPAQES